MFLVFIKSIAINLTFPGVDTYISYGGIGHFTPITLIKILPVLFFSLSNLNFQVNFQANQTPHTPLYALGEVIVFTIYFDRGGQCLQKHFEKNNKNFIS